MLSWQLKPATARDLVPIEGFWSVPWATTPNTFAECPFPKDCQGFPKDGVTIANSNSNSTNSTIGCRIGNGGVLCAVCDQGWTREGSFCNQCTDDTVPTRVGLLIGIVFSLAIVAFCFRRKLKTLHKKYSYMYQDVIRILTINVTFVQVSGSLPNLIPIKWPSTYTNFLAVFSSMDLL